MLIAQDEIFGPVQSILKFKWVKFDSSLAYAILLQNKNFSQINPTNVWWYIILLSVDPSNSTYFIISN